MKILLSVLLLTALSELVSSLTREHIYVDNEVDWFTAQTYCRTNYKDLSTISSEEDYLMFSNATGNQPYGWIGLYKKKNAATYRWSDGNPVTYIQLGWNIQASLDLCVHLNRPVGSWIAKDCSNVIGPFFCYQVPDLILVKENKSWEEALEYCRNNYSDLASLSSLSDLLTAKKTVNGTTVNVWTSLRFLAGEWFWVNGGTLDSQMMVQLPSCPVSPHHCGARNVAEDLWEFRDCDEKLYFLCYT